MEIVKSKRIDETMAREKFETALEEHEQIFEHFFIAKFLGLNFEYLNFNNDGPDNEMLNISFDVNSMFLVSLLFWYFFVYYPK